MATVLGVPNADTSGKLVSHVQDSNIATPVELGSSRLLEAQMQAKHGSLTTPKGSTAQWLSIRIQPTRPEMSLLRQPKSLSFKTCVI